MVEDKSDVRRVGVEALRELGYTVIEAGDGAQALELLEVQPCVDVLFTDLVMPEMTGDALASRALALRPGLRVVYATGYTRGAVAHRGILDPGITLLSKPFALSELAVAMREAMNPGSAGHSAFGVDPASNVA